MYLQEAIELPVSSTTALRELTEIPARDLAEIAAHATSSGEALVQNAGHSRLDAVSQCRFGAQLGRPFSRDSVSRLPLHWWNENVRSLTPGFIGELQVRPVSAEVSELTIVGNYYPRAYLYELVPSGLLSRMATAVVVSLLDQLADNVLRVLPLRA